MTANELFWSNRLFQLVGQYPIQEWRQRTLANETARRLQQDEKHTFFFQQNNLDGTNDTTPHYTTIADNLTFWVNLFHIISLKTAESSHWIAIKILENHTKMILVSLERWPYIMAVTQKTWKGIQNFIIEG